MGIKVNWKIQLIGSYKVIVEGIEKDKKFDTLKKHSSWKYALNKNQLFLVEQFLKDKRNDAVGSITDRSSKSVSLPKLMIKPFCRDTSEWQAFKESFDEAIHKHSTLLNIEKMNYLLSLLLGEAAQCVKA